MLESTNSIFCKKLKVFYSHTKHQKTLSMLSKVVIEYEEQNEKFQDAVQTMAEDCTRMNVLAVILRLLCAFGSILVVFMTTLAAGIEFIISFIVISQIAVWIITQETCQYVSRNVKNRLFAGKK